ncbi:hypothetical protein AHALO_0382 [Malaciobacter halophilus]|nr:hypothetical protein AHALO_0382 [Malaciobacter halophilus]
MKNKKFLHETKSIIGLVHGFTACISTVHFIFINGDYTSKILPKNNKFYFLLTLLD